ncbi:hypothetical protein APHACPA_1539 [Rickettsia amblyommatis str. Ac/Pa]|nr:hypothetical protein APHACPA_1539 [Rickettsia amblyommatis str. Ac/Pa]
MLLVAIAVKLWKNEDIQQKIGIIAASSQWIDSNKWQKIENKVADKAASLPLPNPIKEKVQAYVGLIGREVSDFIKYNAQYTFFSLSETVNYINNIYWEKSGLINYKKTAQALLSRNALNNYDKYRLACTYCLEDEIVIIVQQVSTSDIYWQDCLRSNNILVNFWSSALAGNIQDSNFYTRLIRHNHVNQVDRSLYEYMLLEVISINNAVAVEYIWNKLSDMEKLENIVKATEIALPYKNSKIITFLLSQMEEKQQAYILQNHASAILNIIIMDWPWRDYFWPAIHNILDMIHSKDYFNTLKVIADKIGKNSEGNYRQGEYKEIFRQLWQDAPQHLKKYMFEIQYHKPRYEDVLLAMTYRKNIDLLQLILSEPSISLEQKREIIFSSYGLEKCAGFLMHSRWGLLEIFMKYALTSPEDVESFKEILIKKKGGDLSSYFVKREEWDKLDEFLNWSLKLEEEANKFKLQELVCSYAFIELLEHSVTGDKADFTKVDHFLQQCFKSTNELYQYKTAMFQIDFLKSQFVKLACQLLQESKFELAEQALNWGFLNNQDAINNFKAILLSKKYAVYNTELIAHLICRNDQLQSLKKLTHWCIQSENEINDFKKEILHSKEEMLGICGRLLYRNEFKLADNFVNWCCSASQELVNKFKNQFMLYNNISDIFDELDLENNNPAEVIKWFNPSLETIEKFKEKFKNEWWFENVLNQLDAFIQRQKDKKNIEEEQLIIVSNVQNHLEQGAISNDYAVVYADNSTLELGHANNLSYDFMSTDL